MNLTFYFVLNLLSTSANEVIIVQDSKEALSKPKAFVESGSDKIQGSPEEHPKAAYRTWQTACSQWKAELLKLNAKNLMFSSCGVPKRIDEMHLSQKIYSFQSDAKYKIRVQP